MIKLIATDLDGSLLNNKNEIDDFTEEVFKRAHQQGLKIVIATGRSYNSVPDWIKRLEYIDFIISSNGADIRENSTDEVIYENHIPNEKVLELCNFLESRDNMVEAFTNGIGYISEKDYEDIREARVKYRSVDYVLSTRKPVENIFTFIKEHINRIENINIFVDEPSKKDDFIEEITKIKDISVTSSFPYNIEVGASNTTKAQGISHLCKILKINPRETIAFGDNHNDIEMIKESGIGVAMGNGEAMVKEVADYITSTNDESGVAKAILKFEILDN